MGTSRGRRGWLAGGVVLLWLALVVALVRPDGETSLSVRSDGDARPPAADGPPDRPDERAPPTTIPASPSSTSPPSTRGRATTTTTAVPAIDPPEAACVEATPIYSFALALVRPGLGWVAGGGPALRASDDDGSTWGSACLPPTDPGAALHGVAFRGDRGWAVGQSDGRPLVVVTDDGGSSWRASAVPDIAASLSDVAFAGPGRGWAVGAVPGQSQANAQGGVVLRSEDGGVSWSVEPLPAGATGRLNALSVVDTTHLWAVGATLEGAGVVVASADGGSTWTVPPLPDGVLELKDVAFADARRGWAVGYAGLEGGRQGGLVLATTDGGLTWTRQLLLESATLWSLERTADGALLAGGGGSSGELWASDDDGATWARRSTLHIPTLTDVAFLDGRRGWVTHEMFSVVCVTFDGGQSWSGRSIVTGRSAGC